MPLSTISLTPQQLPSANLDLQLIFPLFTNGCTGSEAREPAPISNLSLDDLPTGTRLRIRLARQYLAGCCVTQNRVLESKMHAASTPSPHRVIKHRTVCRSIKDRESRGHRRRQNCRRPADVLRAELARVVSRREETKTSSCSWQARLVNFSRE